jgi:tRNA G18 (ribose-2'-O)-methylase SpoU
MIVIDDPDDGRIAQFRMRERGINTRADRREQTGAGLFVAEGDLVVARALDAGYEAVTAFFDVAAPPPVIHRFGPDVEQYAGTEDVRRAGMGLGVPLSIVALFRRPSPLDPNALAGGHRIVALEAVDNPVNIGTVVRSASALGWNGLLLDRTSADPLARRALRVSMGTSFVLPFARSESLVDTVRAARDSGTLVVALALADDATPLSCVLPAAHQPVMLLLGAERTGLSDELLDAASLRATIAMAPGVDSLNAAAAAAVACYALRR